MTNKKLLQLVAIVVVAAAIFTTILLVGLQKIKPEPEPSTLEPALQTTEPTTTPTTADTVPAVTIDGNHFGDEVNPTFPTTGTTASPTATPTTASTTASFQAPTDKTGVIRTYVNAVNALKATPSFTLEKAQTLNVVIDEMTPSSMRTLANKIIEGNKQSAPEHFTFSGGSDAASGKSATFVIAPAGKNAALDPVNVTNATVAPTADGGCTLTLNLADDTQTVSAPPAKLNSCMDVLSVETMGLPSAAKVEEMTVHYTGAVITATLDKDGRITQMEHRVNVNDADVSGSYVVSVSAQMHGDCVTRYQVSYTAA